MAGTPGDTTERGGGEHQNEEAGNDGITSHGINRVDVFKPEKLSQIREVLLQRQISGQFRDDLEANRLYERFPRRQKGNGKVP
jgi:hypothetical protein